MVRLRQALILLVGLAAAGVMVVLGIWQLDVYQAQGEAQAARRASQPPVEVGTVARAGAVVADGYGRPVTAGGRYLPDVQTLVPIADRPGSFRVVSALRLADGDVLPVVRGIVTGSDVPAPPRGDERETGVLLPSEEAPPGDLPPGQLSSVRVTTLAQEWPGPLVAGFVTLDAADAAAQGLEAAPVELPEASGRLRNGAYALQWWVFAAFTLYLASRIARDQELEGLDLTDEGDPGTAVADVTTGEQVRAT